MFFRCPDTRSGTNHYFPARQAWQGLSFPSTPTYARPRTGHKLYQPTTHSRVGQSGGCRNPPKEFTFVLRRTVFSATCSMSPLQVKVEATLHAPAGLTSARRGDQPGLKPALIPIDLTTKTAGRGVARAPKERGGSRFKLPLSIGHSTLPVDPSFELINELQTQTMGHSFLKVICDQYSLSASNQLFDAE